jgi:uncharacterized protein YxjI
MIQLFIKENSNNNQHMTVRDNRGQFLYFIEGRWGRKDDIMSIYDVEGQHLMTLKQQKLSPIPTFDIFENSDKTGTMRKHPGLFGIRDSYFTVHPHDWVITGDFEELYFTAYQENDLIMECDKDLTNGENVYELKVENEEDAPLCALISTIFDHYSRKKDGEEETEESFEEDYDLGFLNYLPTSLSIHYTFISKTKTS